MRNVLAVIILFALLFAVVAEGSSSSSPTTDVSLNFVISGKGSLLVLTANGLSYRVNGTETIKVPADIEVAIVSTQLFSVNGSMVTNEYELTPTSNTTLYIVFMNTTVKTNTTQQDIRSVLTIITAVFILAVLYYLSRKDKEE